MYVIVNSEDLTRIETFKGKQLYLILGKMHVAGMFFLHSSSRILIRCYIQKHAS